MARHNAPAVARKVKFLGSVDHWVSLKLQRLKTAWRRLANFCPSRWYRPTHFVFCTTHTRAEVTMMSRSGTIMQGKYIRLYVSVRRLLAATGVRVCGCVRVLVWVPVGWGKCSVHWPRALPAFLQLACSQVCMQILQTAEVIICMHIIIEWRIEISAESFSVHFNSVLVCFPSVFRGFAVFNAY